MSSDQAIDQNDSKWLGKIKEVDAERGLSASKAVRDMFTASAIIAAGGGVKQSRLQAQATRSKPQSLKQLQKDDEREKRRKLPRGTVNRSKRAAARMRRQLAKEQSPRKQKKTTRPTFGCGHRRCPNPPPTRYALAEAQEVA